MCGIAGLLWKDRRPVDDRLLASMATALAHRGPDGSGTWVHGHLGFAHRRLAIIDLATGDQPMSDPSGRCWITYNGEIYNYRELRTELAAREHRFRTDSDTEVILHAWIEWGEECVARLRGMFAFAVADLADERLFLARDHFGIKPLYYVDTPAVFGFASELQALHRIPALALDLDLESVDQYLRLQYIPAPSTIYRQARKLGPGESMARDFTGRGPDPRRYWRISFDPDPTRTEDEWLERLDATIEDSVRAHLVADVDFGAFLSGGVDSSLVVTKMAKLLGRPVRTFTIGFDDPRHDESGYAQQVADKWRTEHRVEILQPDALQILPHLVRHYGEPFGDSSAIPTYYVSRLAARSVPMVLSGDGGDELFAGYSRYQTFARWLAFDGRPTWRRLAYPVAHLLRPRRYRRRTANLAAWLDRIEVTPWRLRRQLWRPELRPSGDRIPATLVAEFRHASGRPAVQMAQMVDFNTYLPGAILTKVDVASMMSSLEVRTPLLDRRVVEVAAAIPPQLNFRRSPDGDFIGKRLLKTLLSRDFPRSFGDRPKTGFSIPIEHWFGSTGSLHEAVQARLVAADSPLEELFQAKAIETMLADNLATPLWLLLFLDEWLRQQTARSA